MRRWTQFGGGVRLVSKIEQRFPKPKVGGSTPLGTASESSKIDKTRLLEDLCGRAASILKIDADKITGDILKREELGSTGIGSGVAIPHARIAVVKKPFGLLARLKSAT